MTTRRKPLRYFFYNGELHKKIHVHKSLDIITAWNYPSGKMCKHVYSDVMKNGEKAFSTQEVATMVRRNRITLERAILAGNIHRPQITYGLDADRKQHSYYWREKDIMELHAHLSNVHIGRPRRDGMISTGTLPSASELRALVRQRTILYVKNDEGNFVPTWQAEKF